MKWDDWDGPELPQILPKNYLERRAASIRPAEIRADLAVAEVAWESARTAVQRLKVYSSHIDTSIIAGSSADLQSIKEAISQVPSLGNMRSASGIAAIIDARTKTDFGKAADLVRAADSITADLTMARSVQNQIFPMFVSMIGRQPYNESRSDVQHAIALTTTHVRWCGETIDILLVAAHNALLYMVGDTGKQRSGSLPPSENADHANFAYEVTRAAARLECESFLSRLSLVGLSPLDRAVYLDEIAIAATAAARDSIFEARGTGIAWTVIGEAFDVSGQAAYRRFDESGRSKQAEYRRARKA